MSILADAALAAHGEYSPCPSALLSTAVESTEDSDIPLIDGFVNLVQVGQGGFSVVYSADEIAFTRRVALKVLNFTGDEARRLEREARALGVLSDIPNIVQVFQITHTNDGRSVLVMALMQEPVPRENRQTIQQQLVALAWLDQVAQALDKAHLRGVYHRDIKPENILLAADGSANLVDFGIAGLGGLASGTTTAFSFSPPFAPPERLTGTEVDLRAGDIYSLGSTFYAVFTGSAPFGTTTDGGVHGLITRVVTAIPDQPQWMNAATHAALLTAMAKDPSDRFASASEFAAELRNGISDSPVPEVLPPPFIAQDSAGPEPENKSKPRTIKVLAGVAAALIALSAVALFFLLTQNSKQQSDQTEQAAIAPSSNLVEESTTTYEPNTFSVPTISVSSTTSVATKPVGFGTCSMDATADFRPGITYGEESPQTVKLFGTINCIQAGVQRSGVVELISDFPMIGFGGGSAGGNGSVTWSDGEQTQVVTTTTVTPSDLVVTVMMTATSGESAGAVGTATSTVTPVVTDNVIYQATSFGPTFEWGG